MALMFRVSDHGHAFATRERGAELRRVLLEEAVGHAEVVVDFNGVANVSYSFADEFVGKLCEAAPLRVTQRNLSQRVANIVERAVARRTGSALPC
jgi:hypothetical protein